MKITITMHGRDWGGEDIEKAYSPRPESIIKRMRKEYELGVEMTPFHAIIALAMKKWYGSNAFFWRDRGLWREGIYGQVCEPCDTNSNSCITPRVIIRIDVDGHDVCSDGDLSEIEGAGNLYKAFHEIYEVD